jgi:hypothetical protein
MGTFGVSRRDRRGCKGGWAGGRAGRDAGGPLRPVFGDAESREYKPDYKTAALCKHVRRIVGLTLAGECSDPVLQDLIVDEVLPAPNAGRLLVRVLLRLYGPESPGVIEVLQRLAAVQGLLRMRVGETIARKRTPELVFDVIPIASADRGNTAEPEVLYE